MLHVYCRNLLCGRTCRRYRMSQLVRYTAAAYSRPEASNMRHNGRGATPSRFRPTPFGDFRRGKRPPRGPERPEPWGRQVVAGLRVMRGCVMGVIPGAYGGGGGVSGCACVPTPGNVWLCQRGVEKESRVDSPAFRPLPGPEHAMGNAGGQVRRGGTPGPESGRELFACSLDRHGAVVSQQTVEAGTARPCTP